MSWVPFPCSVDLILCWYLWVGNDFNMNWWHTKFFLNHFVHTFRNQTHTYKYKHIVCVYGHPFIYPESNTKCHSFLGHICSLCWHNWRTAIKEHTYVLIRKCWNFSYSEDNTMQPLNLIFSGYLKFNTPKHAMF